MKTYTTKQGDMWDSIAYSQMGNAAHKDKLMAANIQYRNIYIFPAGFELVIPDVSDAVVSDALPPWKRVQG